MKPINTYKTYGELDIYNIRKTLDIDFASFSYMKGHSTKTHTIYDQPKEFWREQIVPRTYSYIVLNKILRVYNPDAIKETICVSYDPPIPNTITKNTGKYRYWTQYELKEPTYIIFRNAKDTWGAKNENDPIKSGVEIEYNMPDDKEEKLYRMLNEKLGEYYRIVFKKKYLMQIIKIR